MFSPSPPLSTVASLRCLSSCQSKKKKTFDARNRSLIVRPRTKNKMKKSYTRVQYKSLIFGIRRHDDYIDFFLLFIYFFFNKHIIVRQLTSVFFFHVRPSLLSWIVMMTSFFRLDRYVPRQTGAKQNDVIERHTRL